LMPRTQLGLIYEGLLRDLNPNMGTASGRYVFQYGGLEYLLNSKVWIQVFGRGFGYSRVVSASVFSLEIGMHNDFLDITIGLGLLGLTAYIVFLSKLLRLSSKDKLDPTVYDSFISSAISIVVISTTTGGFFEISAIMAYIALSFSIGYTDMINQKGIVSEKGRLS